MGQLTESDTALLRVVADLLDRTDGRPPSFAEIAVASGLQASSRSNVQRQLSRLRPAYVDWTSSARSLRLTEAGWGVARGQTDTGYHAPTTTPVPDMILPLLASGLTHMVHEIADGKPLQAPFHSAWQRGMNILAVECMMRQIEPPTHTQALVGWCQKPPTSWPVRFSMQSRLLDTPLLDPDDQPTVFCRELADSIRGDAEHEICQHLMRDIRNTAEFRRQQAAYVAFRSYLITHPVVSQYELITASMSSSLSIFGGDIRNFYERVPDTVFEDHRVPLCPHCGWTLTRREGRLRCDGDFCVVATRNFADAQFLHHDADEPLMRVRKAIRKYVVAPGRYEYDAYQRLQSFGVHVELWPGYDAYDLRIVFADGVAWAVDVKDWMYPHLLASRLGPLPQEGELRWDRAFYAVPDIRVQHDKDYLAFLSSATAGQPFKVVTINDLLRQVQQRAEVHYA
jgi:hypothetical protein